MAEVGGALVMEDCGGLDADAADSFLDTYGSVFRRMRTPDAEETQLLRSRKRNFSEGEVDALLRGVFARRKKLLATPADGVPRWQRTLMWKQVTEAVNVASGHRNRRTTGEVKKKWSDIKIEAKKRRRSAAERGDDALLRPQDKRIMCILDPDQNLDRDRDQSWDRDPDQSWDWDRDRDPGPTIVHVTAVKSEPQLSESEPSSSSPPAELHADRVQTEPQPPPHCMCTEHAQRDSYTECAPGSDLMVALLKNQQQILETLRNMNDTFSQISSSLKDISHSLRR